MRKKISIALLVLGMLAAVSMGLEKTQSNQAWQSAAPAEPEIATDCSLSTGSAGADDSETDGAEDEESDAAFVGSSRIIQTIRAATRSTKKTVQR